MAQAAALAGVAALIRMESDVRAMQLPLRDLQLPSGEVHLWHLQMADLPDPAAHEPQAGIDNAASRSFASSRLLRFQQRFYLRLLLAAHLHRPAHAVRIGRTASGKPYVATDAGVLAAVRPSAQHTPTSRPPLYFSLSHVGSAMLVALCRDHPLGVDMEVASRRVRDPMRMARRHFHPAEVRWLQALPPAQQAVAFMRLWTCKEAVVKATGGGIVSGLDRFAVALSGQEVSLTAAINEPSDDVLHSLHITTPAADDDMLVAVAHAASVSVLRSFKLLAAAAAREKSP